MTRQRRKLTFQTKSKRKTPSRQKNQTVKFGDHISELRRRGLYVGLVFLLGSGLAYSYRHELLSIILAPLKDQKLVYLTPGGGFAFIFQISIYAGLLLAAPLLVYHLHAFIRPALPLKAQKSLHWMTLLASFLIVGGVTYGYFVAIPSAITFLSTFAEDAVTPNLTADSYLSFFLAYIGGIALLSLIPLVIMFWHWIKPLTPGGTLKSEQWIILLAFVLAAIITPTPDVVNQLMIAGPVIGIYQIGVLAVLTSIVQTRRRDKKAIKLQLASAARKSALVRAEKQLMSGVAASPATRPLPSADAMAASSAPKAFKQPAVFSDIRRAQSSTKLAHKQQVSLAAASVKAQQPLHHAYATQRQAQPHARNEPVRTVYYTKKSVDGIDTHVPLQRERRPMPSPLIPVRPRSAIHESRYVALPRASLGIG